MERLADDLDEAFADLVRRYGAMVTTAAARYGPEGDADDLAQEAFVRAYAALRRYPPARVRSLDLAPWLVTIARNLGRNAVRDRSRRPAADTGTARGSGREEIDTRIGPEQQVLDRHGDAARLLCQLPPAQAEAVLLRHVVGLDTAGVAQVLGCPPGTARSHISRGVKRLRALLDEARSEEAATGQSPRSHTGGAPR